MFLSVLAGLEKLKLRPVNRGNMLEFSSSRLCGYNAERRRHKQCLDSQKAVGQSARTHAIPLGTLLVLVSISCDLFYS